MPDTKRETIAQEVVALLELITGASFDPPIGDNVIRSDFVGLDVNMPGIAVALGVEEVTRIYRKEEIKLPVIITASAPYDTSADRVAQAEIISKQAETMLGYVRAAMVGPWSTPEACHYARGGIEDYPDPRQGATAVVVLLEYHFTYKTGLHDPY